MKVTVKKKVFVMEINKARKQLESIQEMALINLNASHDADLVETYTADVKALSMAIEVLKAIEDHREEARRVAKGYNICALSAGECEQCPYYRDGDCGDELRRDALHLTYHILKACSQKEANE